MLTQRENARVKKKASKERKRVASYQLAKRSANTTDKNRLKLD